MSNKTFEKQSGCMLSLMSHIKEAAA